MIKCSASSVFIMKKTGGAAMSGIKSSGLCGWEQQSTQTRRRSEEQRGNRVQGGVRYSGSRQEQGAKPDTEKVREDNAFGR